MALFEHFSLKRLLKVNYSFFYFKVRNVDFFYHKGITDTFLALK